MGRRITARDVVGSVCVVLSGILGVIVGLVVGVAIFAVAVYALFVVLPALV